MTTTGITDILLKAISDTISDLEQNTDSITLESLQEIKDEIQDLQIYHSRDLPKSIVQDYKNRYDALYMIYSRRNLIGRVNLEQIDQTDRALEGLNMLKKSQQTIKELEIVGQDTIERLNVQREQIGKVKKNTENVNKNLDKGNSLLNKLLKR